MQSRCLVIIPTYNEVLNITTLLRVIIKTDERLDVLVVDDSSPDGTSQVIKTEFLSDERVNLLSRKEKLGIGSAYIEGFKWALDRGYEYVMEMDADFSHKPGYIPEFLKNIEEYDLVLGSRYIKGGGTENWGLLRRLISRTGSLYSRLVLGLKVKDLTGGFKCFKTDVFKNIDFDRIKSSGYSFQVELTYLISVLDKKIKEIPIIFEDRRVGKSKLSKRDIFKAFILVPKLRFLGKKHPAFNCF